MLPYFEVHEGAGPPLLMVHGVLSSRAQWLDNLEALKGVASPVVVELFGHGRSPAPRERECYRPSYYVAAFEGIRQELQADAWLLLGYSLGAGLTLRYSLTYPERVLAQVFTNSSSAFATEETGARFRGKEEIILQYEAGGLAAVERIAVHPRHAKKLPVPVREALLADCEQLDPGGVGRTLVETNGYASVRDLIGGNTTPSLLACGEMEKRFQPLRQFVAAEMPHLSIVDLPAGHAVNIEAATQFNQVVTEFFAAHLGSSAHSAGGAGGRY